MDIVAGLLPSAVVLAAFVLLIITLVRSSNGGSDERQDRHSDG